METLTNEQYNKAIRNFIENKIGVIPTDTLYGISCLALNQELVSRVYEIKNRNETKPFIVIISNIKDVVKLGAYLTPQIEEYAKNVWPGPVSILLPIDKSGFEYLHKGTGYIAFRIPKKVNLLKMLEQTGPLVSTTANISGKEPAKNIQKAIEYLGDRIDFYIDEGSLDNPPSRVVKIENREIKILR